MTTSKTTAFIGRRKMLFSLLIVSMFFLTCKKTTIINNYITNPPVYETGLVKTPDSVYSGIPVATIPTAPLQESFSLQIPNEPFNQGTIQGSCASCASAMAKSILDHTQNNTAYPSNQIIYSPAFLYNQVKLFSDCSKGSRIDANLDKIKVQGVCKEVEMPYVLNNCSTLPTTAQIALASNNKIDDYETVPLNATAIKQIINTGSPVVVGFLVDDKFTYNYWNSNYINTVWSTFGTAVIDNQGSPSAHATLLYGWDDGKNSFRMLNSWGNGWGNAGSIWVDYSLVENNAVFFQAYKLVNSTSTNINNLSINGDLNFGNTTINTSSTKTIQLVNNTTSTINVSSISITSPFSINWSSSSIQAGASRDVTVTFNPTSLGNASSALTINSNAANSPITIQASGAGVQQTSQTKIISLTGNLFYGDVIVGQSSVKTFTISNLGNSAINVSSLSTADGFIGAFNGTVQPGIPVDVYITFSPLQAQPYSGNITVNSDATSGVNTIGAIGNGISSVSQTRIISLSGNLNYGDVVVGQSLSKTLKISNSGNSPLTVSSISIPQGYSLGNYNQTVQPGSYNNVSITFTPSNDQPYNGNVTVTSDATSGVNTKSISGTGISNSVTVSPPLGSYGSCATTNTLFCPEATYETGVINARVVSVNTSTHQIVIEISKCNGTSFNSGGHLNVDNFICSSAGHISYGTGLFQSGIQSYQLTINDQDMTGSKAYLPYIIQVVGSNSYFYSAPTIVITY
jgi:C1A family cysteine protease